MLNLLYGPTLTSVHDYWKNHSLTIQIFVGKLMSPLFNMLFRFLIDFLPRSKHLNLKTVVTVRSDFGAQENKVCHSTPFILAEGFNARRPDAGRLLSNVLQDRLSPLPATCILQPGHGPCSWSGLFTVCFCLPVHLVSASLSTLKVCTKSSYTCQIPR